MNHRILNNGSSSTAGGVDNIRSHKNIRKKIVYMFDCVPTLCYNTAERLGDVMKSNAEAVAKYHEKIQDIKIRVPQPDVCGIDYLKLMKERAEELGITNTKGKNQGEGNVNQYVLSLIAKDLNIDEINTSARIAKTKKD